MIIKSLLAYLLDKQGLVAIPKWRLDNLLLSNRIQRIISEYQIDCIIDVGANTGQYGKFLRKQVGYTGLIFSFEPDPTAASALKKASHDDEQWHIQNYALGSEDNSLKLNIMEASVFNSFLEPDNSKTDRYQSKNQIKTSLEVRVKRLDEVLPELQTKHQFSRVFLKLDTQGFDLEVFSGASGCRDSIYGVQSEVSVLPIYENMPTFEESLKVFRSKGYEVSGLYSITEARFPHAHEFDCIYLPSAPDS